jgi:hypothetical protein
MYILEIEMSLWAERKRKNKAKLAMHVCRWPCIPKLGAIAGVIENE